MRLRPAKARQAPPSVTSAEPGQLDEGPTLLSMVRIVAITVALIILVSFAAGYGFARLFL
jgi:hypothetical protein